MPSLKKSQQSLKNWSSQDWDNLSGKKGDRYLPKSVRESLSPGQISAENKKKRAATAAGKPSAPYTKDLAKKVRNASEGMRLKKREVGSRLVKRFSNGGSNTKLNLPSSYLKKSRELSSNQPKQGVYKKTDDSLRNKLYQTSKKIQYANIGPGGTPVNKDGKPMKNVVTSTVGTLTGITPSMRIAQSRKNFKDNPSKETAKQLAVDTIGTIPLGGKVLGASAKYGPKALKYADDALTAAKNIPLVKKGLGILKGQKLLESFDLFKDGGINPPQQPPVPKIGPKKNEFGATNYPGGPDNPFVDEMSVPEKSVNQRALESINTIDGLFPGAKDMLIETAIIESKIGKDNRAGNNYMQLTKTGIKGITDFDSHPGLKNYYNKFEKETGIDATKATEEEWKSDPLLQAFGARLMYGKVPEAIPKTMKERAAYWDRYYNSTIDEEGDAASYIKQVTEYQNK